MEHAPEAEFPLLAHVDQLVENLRAQIPRALKDWDVEAIHQSRVATRRLKAALDLMEPVLTKRHRRPFARVLRRLRRRLGPLRDADVMLEHLGELSAINPRHAAAIGWLSDGLCRGRQALREESQREGPPAKVLSQLGSWYYLREEIAEAREAISPLVAQSVHLQLDAFAEQADRLVAGIGATHPSAPSPANGATAAAAGIPPAPDALPVPAAAPHGGRQDPHELRISGKALRYTLEMAAAAGHPLPKKATRTFKRMQEMLGLWHDFVVLTDRAMRASLDELLSHHDPALQERVFDLARVTLRRSARQLNAFGRFWSARGEDLTRSIRAGFPLTRPVPPAGHPGAAADATGPKTGLGPSGSGETSAPPACPPAAASTA